MFDQVTVITRVGQTRKIVSHTYNLTLNLFL